MYPRPTGHCYSHHIPANIVTPEDKLLLSKQELLRALQYLRDINTDLVKGDLVIFDASAGYRNTGVSIFDGTQIIELDDEPDEYGTLPKFFRVIEDGVPIKYWESIDNTNQGFGINHNVNVWFDHSKVLQQCLDNISFGPINHEYQTIYTTFHYGQHHYKIIYECYDDNFDVTHYITEFASRLSNLSNLLEFEYKGEMIDNIPNALYLKSLDF